MQCAQLSLVNFRNYVRLDLDLTSETVVVVGENAQGKSNLLEAIYCLATTKSFRAGSDRLRLVDVRIRARRKDADGEIVEDSRIRLFQFEDDRVIVGSFDVVDGRVA